MSEDIVLRSDPMIITEIVKRTRAIFWKDRKVNDVVVFEYVLKHPGSNRGQVYATDIHVFCGDEEVRDTPSGLSERVKCFTFMSVYQALRDNINMTSGNTDQTIHEF